MSLMSGDDMKRVFRLPKLPSNTYGEELLRHNYHKAQLLARPECLASHVIPTDYDTLMVTQSIKKSSLGSLTSVSANELRKTNLSSTMSAVGANHPSLALDKKVLRYYCFFRETVPESPLERERVRKCVLLYHLEDDTVSVSEIASENSGMPQGTLIRRHQIPSVVLEKLTIGADVTIYSKVFHITDCDNFTRVFMNSAQIPCPAPESEPLDEFTRRRQQEIMQRSKKAVRCDEFNLNAKMTPQEVRNTTQFLALDRYVLRFRATWDDSKAHNGMVRFFSLYYFLADDTIEVIEEDENNSGRDPFPSFVRRQKCPRVEPGSKFENATASLTFSNRRDQTACYTDADLRIGARVNIFGREFFLYDCDENTKRHLREKFSITDFTPIAVRSHTPPPVKREPPPHNGFGDEEDALGSWKHLVLKPPKRDATKYMEHSGTTLKFEMCLDASDPCNKLRRFVLTFYISDETLAIFEPPLRNSGIVAGKFLQRSKIKNPETGTYFRAAELYIGKRIVIHDHAFVLLACDERSLAFMEQHSNEFPYSDMNRIMCKLRSMLSAGHVGLRAAFLLPSRANMVITYADFMGLLKEHHLELSPQEVLTMFRYFEHNKESDITYSMLHHRLCTDASGCAIPVEETADWWMLYQRWILQESLQENSLQRHVRQKGTTQRTRAAYAARRFFELYQERKQLFNTCFNQICDYSPDGLIGAEQFRTVVDETLSLGFEKEAVSALCERLFPVELRRASYSEFLKLLNGTSSHAHNLDAIIKREQ